MNRILCPFAFFILLVPFVLPGQDTLFFENFEQPSNGFTLNTTDLGGASGTQGANRWIVNNAYTGGSGTVICLSFPFTYIVANTPAQPAAIQNSPNSNYLHTISDAAIVDNIFCSSYAAADGLCFLPETNFSRITAPINTVGRDTVTLSFWWNCGGGTAIHGEVHYSTNGGTSWTQLTSPISQYKNQTSWVQQTITDPAFAQQSSLTFGFRFVNNTSNTATDPGFSIDDILVIGKTGAAVTTQNPNPLPPTICGGDSIQVPYTATGAFQPGNVFTAELSDANGSFAVPVVIGTVSSTTSGTIPVVIPQNALTGSAYRIRVLASAPAVTGADNGTDLSIAELPLAGTLTATPDSLCSGETAVLNLSGAQGVINWSKSTDGGSNFQSFGPPQVTSLTTDPLYAANGNVFQVVLSSATCPLALQQIPIFVDTVQAAFSFLQTGTFQFDFTDGSFNAVAWDWDFGDGNSSSQQNPSYVYASAGNYVVTLIATSALGCRDTVTDTVSAIVGLSPGLTGLRFEAGPNPFSSELGLELAFPHTGQARLRILDIQGREVVQLVNGEVAVGEQRLIWRPGTEVTAGIYFAELQFAGELRRKKLILMR
jgi:PKD repeat protein